MKKEKPLSEQLTTKQELFCQFYVDIGIGIEAYKLAGYATERMKVDSIYKQCVALKHNPKIARRIQELMDERVESTKVSREKVEKVMMDIIMNDPADLYYTDDVTGKLKMKTPRQMSKPMRNALKKLSNKRGEVSYEFNGKTEAARLLGSWNGWDAPKQVDISNNGEKFGELRIGFDDESEK